MIARMLDRLFLFIVSREMGIVLGIGICVAMVPILLEQLYSLRTGWATHPSHQQLQEMEGLIDGLAGILVAGGVFFESRETLRNMALRKKEEEDPLQLWLNQVAHHNGMGLLLVGLFVEIGTAVTGLPKRVFDFSGLERGIFGVCFALSACSLIIMLDFVKDFARTYLGVPRQEGA